MEFSYDIGLCMLTLAAALGVIYALRTFLRKDKPHVVTVEPIKKRSEKVAIVGGGFSGIGSVAMLKDEGFEPVCFEKTDMIGGTWCYREESEFGVASVMPTTIINHSKEIGALSNFPPRKEFSNYMRHWELYQCMQEFMDARDIKRHIKTNHEVTAVKRAPNYDSTGQWTVTVKDTSTGDISTDTYDRVIIAVGHFNRPKTVSYPGQNIFKGRIMHTHSLKRVDSFKGKRVLVVGMGCSALDAAVEISSVAKQVYLSTRSGAHVINRLGPHGYPVDYVLLRRFITVMLDILPASLCAWFIQRFFLDPKFDNKLYQVEPDHHMFAKDPVLNDHLGSKLLSGAVKQKRDIIRFTENGVVFHGEEDRETAIDDVIMATGYDWKFPFLEEGVLNIDKATGRIDLYKCMWPAQLVHSTLAFIGFILPFGPGFPLGELQCRYAARVFAGHKQLPPREEMVAEVVRRHNRNVQRYKPNDKMTVRVDHVQYMDEIAEEVGCKPNLCKLFFTDPKLFFKLAFGPCVSYQYRLSGPHAWDGARQAILTVDDRLHYPLNGAKKKVY